MYPYDYSSFNIGQPPFGRPPGFPGGPGRPPGAPGPGRPPGAPPQLDRPPQGPPPSFTPRQPMGVMAIDPGGIRICRYRYTYIWPTRGRGFWTYLTFIGRRSVSGYRWMGFFWIPFGTDLNNISSFICY